MSGGRSVAIVLLVMADGCAARATTSPATTTPSAATREVSTTTATPAPCDVTLATDCRAGDERRAARERERRDRAATEASATTDRRADAERHHDAERVADHAAYVAAKEAKQADLDAFKADRARLGDSCADADALEKLADAHPGARELYLTEAASRRTARAQPLAARIRGAVSVSPRCDTADDVVDARAVVASTKDALAQLRCFDAATALELTPQVDTWSTSREIAISDDEKCIAKSGCVPKAIAVQDVCPSLTKRADVLAEIARIRRYGATTGVVDARALYDLGEALKMLDDDIAKSKAHYSAIAKRSFDESSCRTR